MKSNPAASGSVAVVDVPGDILSTTVQALRPQWTERMASLPPGADAVLELRLEQTRMIDSAGLNLLVFAIRTMRDRGGRVRLAGAGEHVRRTLIFTRLHQQVELL